MEIRFTRALEATLDHLEQQALDRDIASDVTAEARRATARALNRSAARIWGPADERRAAAYFSAVVRRMAVRRGQPARGAARFVIATIVEDLRASGRDGEAIWDQLQRGWGDSVPGDVLEEYRLRLCG
jgi:hypothetical protein